MSNLRNILGKASDAFRNTTVVCEENKVNMLRMAAKIACFGNFGFLSKLSKLTVCYCAEIVFSALVLKAAVTKLTKQANLISIAVFGLCWFARL